jgi:hypothetical protein
MLIRRKNKYLLFFVTAISLLLFFRVASAGILINEIMYDPAGTDSGREWIEIENTDSASIDVTGWKFADVVADGTISNHNLYVPPDHGGVGGMTISAGSFAILAADALTFLGEYSGSSGTVIDTTISNFGQQEGRTYCAKLFNKDGTEIDSVCYTIGIGAKDDGNSLQKIDGVWKASKPTPGALNVFSDSGNNGGTDQNENQTTATSSQNSTQQTQTSSSSSGSGGWPVEPQILAKISGETVAIVGAEAIYRGQTLGLDKKPLINARFLWNFGDGGSKEGETVAHIYSFPGNYTVVLDVSSDKYSASDRIKVKAVVPEIIISKIVFGADGAVEISNNSNYELNLSYWKINSNGGVFIMPKNTILAPKSSLIFPSKITGLSVGDDTALFFPNGSLLTRYESAGKIVGVENKSQVAVPVISVSKKESTANNKSVELKAESAPAGKASAGPSDASDSSGLSAGVGNISENSNNSPIYKWLLAILGLSVVAGFSVFFFKTEKEINAKKAEEITDIKIIED